MSGVHYREFVATYLREYVTCTVHDEVLYSVAICQLKMTAFLHATREMQKVQDNSLSCREL